MAFQSVASAARGHTPNLNVGGRVCSHDARPTRRPLPSERESRGIMRGREVISGVLAVCGAVALSACADQHDFIAQLDSHADQ